MTSPTGAARAADPTPKPTHPCLRCGRPVAIDVALCDQCNPLGLKQPAATQVHAIAAGGIVLFVIFLGIVGRLALGGIGPFTGSIASVAPATGGLAVTVAVTNAGTKNSATTCRVVGADREVGGPSQVLQTPNVPGGQTVEFATTMVVFGTELRDLAVDCQSP